MIDIVGYGVTQLNKNKNQEGYRLSLVSFKTLKSIICDAIWENTPHDENLTF